MDSLSNIPPGIDLMQVPMAHNPDGMPPNFIDPPSLQPELLALGLSLIIVSAPILALRLYANLKHSKKFYLDDVSILLGWFGGIAYWSVSYSMVAGGSAGRHAWDTPIGVILAPTYMKRMFVQTVFGHFNLWIIRAAILVFYIRIFDSVRWVRIISWTLIILSGIFYAASIFVSVGYCTPRAGEGWSSVSFTKCADPIITKFSIASGAANSLSDCITFAMPFPIIARLQLSRRKKIGVFIVFSVAICTVVASGASLAYRIMVYNGVNDSTWIATKLIMTSLCEQFGTVMVGCAPGLACFWSNVFTKTQLYSSIRSNLQWRHSNGSKKTQNTAPHSYGSDERLQEKKSHKPFTDLESARGNSYNEEQFKCGFITSAITRATTSEQSTHTM